MVILSDSAAITTIALLELADNADCGRPFRCWSWLANAQSGSLDSDAELMQ